MLALVILLVTVAAAAAGVVIGWKRGSVTRKEGIVTLVGLASGGGGMLLAGGGGTGAFTEDQDTQIFLLGTGLIIAVIGAVLLVVALVISMRGGTSEPLEGQAASAGEPAATAGGSTPDAGPEPAPTGSGAQSES